LWEEAPGARLLIFDGLPLRGMRNSKWVIWNGTLTFVEGVSSFTLTFGGEQKAERLKAE